MALGYLARGRITEKRGKNRNITKKDFELKVSIANFHP